jgi:hypothetical protein
MATETNEDTQPVERNELEELREILFGARARDTERRLAHLDAKLSSELNALRDELSRRLSGLEAHVRDEIEAMSTRIDAEATARVDATSQLAKSTSEAATAIELRVNRVDESGARNHRELRRQILDMTRELGAQIGRARQELFTSIDKDRSGVASPVEIAQESEGERLSRH